MPPSMLSRKKDSAYQRMLLSSVLPMVILLTDKTGELVAMRSINGDEKIYKKVVPMILKIRESSEKNDVK